MADTKCVEAQKKQEVLQREVQVLKMWKKEHQEKEMIGGNIEGKVSYDQLKREKEELEVKNKQLKATQQTVVVYNKKFGTFEYIGDRNPLNFNRDCVDVYEIISVVRDWLQKNNRLTVGSIFRSLDINCFNQLNKEQMSQGFEKIGFNIKNSELNILAEYIGEHGFLKYEPLVREFEGIPMEHFIIAPMKKLAKLVLERPMPITQVIKSIDPKKTGLLTVLDFSKAVINQLSAGDFIIDQD